MKSLSEHLICEDASNESKFGKKLDNFFKNNKHKLGQLIQKRQDNWDANKFEWSREPMFLIANPTNDLVETGREYNWTRWHFIEGHKDDIHGTFKNYNLADESGSKPNSVIGVYYDRHFELITSIDVFRQLYDMFKKEFNKD